MDIYSYVTEGTFDAYLYQLVERKQKFIAQIMTSKSPVRSAEDVDEQALSYAEIKALASGNPLIKEKMDLDIEVSKLKLLKGNHLSQRYALEDAISKTFPKSIAETQERIAGYGADITTVREHTAPNADGFSPMTLAGKVYAEKKAAGTELLTLCQNMLMPEPMQIGLYRGLTLELSFDSFSQEYRLAMIGQLRHVVTLGKSAGKGAGLPRKAERAALPTGNGKSGGAEALPPRGRIEGKAAAIGGAKRIAEHRQA